MTGANLSIAQALAVALDHHRGDRWAQAEALYRQIIMRQSDHADALHFLGVLLHQRGLHASAIEMIRQAIASDPKRSVFYSNIGPAYRALGRLDEALAAYEQALLLAPTDADAHNNMGNLLRQMGRFDEAIISFGAALAIKPLDPRLIFNLGGTYCEHERLDQARECYQRGLQLQPGNAQAHNDLGKVFRLQGLLGHASRCFERAIEIDPNHSMAYNNLAGVLKLHGRSADAISCYRQALVIDPSYAAGYSNMLFAMQYSDLIDSPALFAEHLAFARHYEAPLKTFWQAHSNSPDAARRLRVGYVSADFNLHAVAHFVLPVLERHDKSQLEVFCYYNGTRRDVFTNRFEAAADHWLACHALGDEQLAARIRNDQIDILVDLSGHTAGNRLLVFARRPAPVQLTWLGYLGTTGLAAMDYRFTDREMDPPGFSDTIHTEALLRLPHFSPFQPVAACPGVNPLPALEAGKLVLASLNNLAKLSPSVVRLWARILKRLPDSNLMLCNLGDGETAQRVFDLFELQGVGAARLCLQPWMPMLDYLALHHQIDLALDTFPYNGGTITNHSLWMGVPVVTLAGDRPVSRIGASLMTRAGLPEFICDSEDDYLNLVLQLASDLPALNRIRLGLRERLAANLTASPAPLTSRIEQVYREIWQRWCQQAPPDRRVLGAAAVADPANASHNNQRGNSLRDCGQLAAAVDCYQAALAEQPNLVGARLNLANTMKDLGRFEAAVDECRQALAIAPDLADAHGCLAGVLHAQGQFALSERSYTRALELMPDHAQIHCNYADLLNDAGQYGRALEQCRQALALDSSCAPAWLNQGSLLQTFGRLDLALHSFRQSLALRPDLIENYLNMGALLHSQGRAGEAIDLLQQGLALAPSDARLHSNLLFVLSCEARTDDYRSAARLFGQTASTMAQSFSSWPLATVRTGPSTLRVGLVSGDLCSHPVGFFLEAMCSQLDTGQIELFAYTTGVLEDALTSRLKPFFRGWVSLHGSSDQVAASRIRDDGIQILIDLAGHTAKNRLPVFAWRPAPVQVAWLGYWASTGLDQVDYVLVDQGSAPADQQPCFTEAFWYLPKTRWCFSPPIEDGVALTVSDLPACSRGHLTFASFQNLFKLSDAVLALWGRIMQALPTARLRLQNKQMNSPSERQQLERRLATFGIATPRVSFHGPVSRHEYLAAHAEVDIILDTFPFSGGTTTCEGLWMGVPTLTLAGQTLVARQGVSLLRAVELANWIARDEEDYVALAQRFAADLVGLAELRSNLRERLLASPVGDARRFAHALEAALHGMWQQTIGVNARAEAVKLCHLGHEMQALGRLDEALEAYQQAIALEPKLAEAHCNVGNVLQRRGKLDAAVAAYRRALALKPDYPNAYNNLGNALRDGYQLEAALASYQQAITGKPGFFEAHNNRGIALRMLGRLDDAIGSYREALAIKPDYLDSYLNLANVYKEQHKFDEAIACLRHLLSLQANHVNGLNSLGVTLHAQGDLTGALAPLQTALSLQPDFVEAHVNLGAVYQGQGKYLAAIASYRRALELDPQRIDANSNLLFAMSFQNEDFEANSAYLAAARHYGQRVQARAEPAGSWSLPQPGPGQPLRVGLVSGDLHAHPVGYFLEGILARVDPAQVEFLAYPTRVIEDELLTRIKPLFKQWRPLLGLSDADAAARMRVDGIHLLIDLAGHTAYNRLPIFAWRPAPVQISWLGYWASTGLEAIDFVLADQVSVPVSEQVQFVEKLFYLPHTRMCFTPPAYVGLPDPALLPALSRGVITFACFQSLAKINDQVLVLWGRIFGALPQARLYLQNGGFKNPADRAELEQRLIRVGIALERVRLAPSCSRPLYLASYAEVDIVLDTFPYTGGTTTCEALWMGVPTLTLAGRNMLERQGASLLGCVGLRNWVAEGPDDYVARAIAHVGDLPALASLRAGLRARVQASPLFDAGRFAHYFEQALLAMWQLKMEPMKQLDALDVGPAA